MDDLGVNVHIYLYIINEKRSLKVINDTNINNLNEKKSRKIKVTITIYL